MTDGEDANIMNISNIDDDIPNCSVRNKESFEEESLFEKEYRLKKTSENFTSQLLQYCLNLYNSKLKSNLLVIEESDKQLESSIISQKENQIRQGSQIDTEREKYLIKKFLSKNSFDHLIVSLQNEISIYKESKKIELSFTCFQLDLVSISKGSFFQKIQIVRENNFSINNKDFSTQETLSFPINAKKGNYHINNLKNLSTLAKEDNFVQKKEFHKIISRNENNIRIPVPKHNNIKKQNTSIDCNSTPYHNEIVNTVITTDYQNLSDLSFLQKKGNSIEVEPQNKENKETVKETYSSENTKKHKLINSDELIEKIKVSLKQAFEYSIY